MEMRGSRKEKWVSRRGKSGSTTVTSDCSWEMWGNKTGMLVNRMGRWGNTKVMWGNMREKWENTKESLENTMER